MFKRTYTSVAVLTSLLAVGIAAAAQADDAFVAITPCRIVDTRDPPTTPADPLDNQETRGYTIRDDSAGLECGVPAGATAVAVNVTVVTPGARGFLSIFPGDQGFTGTSNLNFPPGVEEFANDNGSIVPLAAGSPDINVYWDSLPTSAPSTYTTHVLIDVFGYFVEITAGGVGAGDVTDVNEGTGIDVTGSTGPTPSVAIEPSYQLPQGCTTGQIATFSAGTWSCAVGAGSVTTIEKDPTVIYFQGSTTTAVPDSSCGAFPCNTASATASCLDTNDVAISGHCDMNPNTNSVILDQDAADWDNTTTAASFTCRWRNDDVNPNNAKATIVCLAVP